MRVLAIGVEFTKRHGRVLLLLRGEVLDYFIASSAAPLPKRLAKGMQLHIASSMSATHSDLGTFNANPAF
jgi:hypothetical protein